ncbi:hypothetical protein [Methylobacter sp.]|uniref:hypothetical protein n=1 Tax=Methylobacter sp. TaxID=2051955 RepID=UPI002488BB47|nr:hypothetical protein [Methylobacter sp.]MDI1278803.1 hypothetical protein [Methylobacter sp.]MDI1358514.1 hypothetical protein [Methylobacter sp.]
MQYDGKGKLAGAIAELCGVSAKNQTRIAALIKQAKDELGITSKAKQMPDDMKLAIYRWHYDRLNPVQDIKRDEGIQVDDEKPVLSPDSVVYDVKQAEGDKLEVLPDSGVQYVKQDDSILNDDVIDHPVYDFKQIHFAVTLAHGGKLKRTTVMLEGYLVKALQRKHGLTDNAAIRAWIEQVIKSDGDRFDNHAPLTRQLKRVIIESFV